MTKKKKSFNLRSSINFLKLSLVVSDVLLGYEKVCFVKHETKKFLLAPEIYEVVLTTFMDISFVFYLFTFGRSIFHFFIFSLCVSDTISALISWISFYKKTWGFNGFALSNFTCVVSSCLDFDRSLTWLNGFILKLLQHFISYFYRNKLFKAELLKLWVATPNGLPKKILGSRNKLAFCAMCRETFGKNFGYCRCKRQIKEFGDKN